MSLEKTFGQGEYTGRRNIVAAVVMARAGVSAWGMVMSQHSHRSQVRARVPVYTLCEDRTERL